LRERPGRASAQEKFSSKNKIERGRKPEKKNQKHPQLTDIRKGLGENEEERKKVGAGNFEARFHIQ